MNGILHKASRIIAHIIAEESVKPGIEELTNIRERIKYGGKMNRRIHSIPFRKTQFYILYKSVEHGFKPEIASANRTCPICGEINKPNRHVFRCKCSLQADRHIVAAWNIALNPQCALPLAAKATYEAFKAKVERIAKLTIRQRLAR